MGRRPAWLVGGSSGRFPTWRVQYLASFPQVPLGLRSSDRLLSLLHLTRDCSPAVLTGAHPAPQPLRDPPSRVPRDCRPASGGEPARAAPFSIDGPAQPPPPATSSPARVDNLTRRSGGRGEEHHHRSRPPPSARAALPLTSSRRSRRSAFSAGRCGSPSQLGRGVPTGPSEEQADGVHPSARMGRRRCNVSGDGWQPREAPLHPEADGGRERERDAWPGSRPRHPPTACRTARLPPPRLAGQGGALPRSATVTNQKETLSGSSAPPDAKVLPSPGFEPGTLRYTVAGGG